MFRAYDTHRNLWVALKISMVESESTRLLREVQLVKNLPSHPNIASYEKCYTFDDLTGQMDVAVLQYYSEGSLADMLHTNRIKPEEIGAVLRQILMGLSFLHEHRLIHRDLKPSNILMARGLDGSLVPKIADFGISKQTEGNDDTVKAAATVSYASPEQLNGQPLSTNTDLWSFGVIAYRLLSGHMPFLPKSGAEPSSLAGRAEIIKLITSGTLPSDIKDLPEPWNKIVASCLVADRSKRANNEQELLNTIDTTKPITPKKTDVRDNTLWLRIGLVVAAVLLIFLAYCIYLDYTKHKPKRIEVPTWENTVQPSAEKVQVPDVPELTTEQEIADSMGWVAEPDTETPEVGEDADSETIYGDSIDFASSYYD